MNDKFEKPSTAEEKLRQWARDNYRPGILDDPDMQMGFNEIILKEWKSIEECRTVVSRFIQTYKNLSIQIGNIIENLPNKNIDDLLHITDVGAVDRLGACAHHLADINNLLDRIDFAYAQKHHRKD